MNNKKVTKPHERRDPFCPASDAQLLKLTNLVRQHRHYCQLTNRLPATLISMFAPAIIPFVGWWFDTFLNGKFLQSLHASYGNLVSLSQENSQAYEQTVEFITTLEQDYQTMLKLICEKSQEVQRINFLEPFQPDLSEEACFESIGLVSTMLGDGIVGDIINRFKSLLSRLYVGFKLPEEIRVNVDTATPSVLLRHVKNTITHIKEISVANLKASQDLQLKAELRKMLVVKRLGHFLALKNMIYTSLGIVIQSWVVEPLLFRFWNGYQFSEQKNVAPYRRYQLTNKDAEKEIVVLEQAVAANERRAKQHVHYARLITYVALPITATLFLTQGEVSPALAVLTTSVFQTALTSAWTDVKGWFSRKYFDYLFNKKTSLIKTTIPDHLRCQYEVQKSSSLAESLMLILFKKHGLITPKNVARIYHVCMGEHGLIQTALYHARVAVMGDVAVSAKLAMQIQTAFSQHLAATEGILTLKSQMEKYNRLLNQEDALLCPIEYDKKRNPIATFTLRLNPLYAIDDILDSLKSDNKVIVDKDVVQVVGNTPVSDDVFSLLYRSLVAKLEERHTSEMAQLAMQPQKSRANRKNKKSLVNSASSDHDQQQNAPTTLPEIRDEQMIELRGDPTRGLHKLVFDLKKTHFPSAMQHLYERIKAKAMQASLSTAKQCWVFPKVIIPIQDFTAKKQSEVVSASMKLRLLGEYGNMRLFTRCEKVGRVNIHHVCSFVPKH